MKNASAAYMGSAGGTGVVFTIGLYVVMSSSMLVINKVAVTFLPAPTIVLFAQLLTSALAAVGLNSLGIVEADELQADKVKRFYIVALVFLSTIFANMKTLQYANVETFIVFRSSTPLVIAVLDYACLGRELPSYRSLGSLMFVTAGAIGYVLTDKEFAVEAYTWVMVWFVVFAVDMVYIKFVVDTVPMTSWGRVYYQNLLALPPLLVLGLFTGEIQDALSVTTTAEASFQWTQKSLMALAASCACGVGMSYSGFRLRKEVSATSFTVIGILCKLGTVAVNVMIWDKHASMTGLGFLLLCMVAGFFYQQAPLRQPRAAAPEDTVLQKS
uniref:Sugar phosphate transporter domain-containing protein n=1 Tax=Pyramimonas obovata TaxID=1411642 RepID=A0A7S0WX23_9CHLO|mmetsp:Transcript_8387/g.17338  ORF Transcript_8387/g.17338 Transcript_8387/m.17338 type:complete len:328 (+) Transcript_8387:276-1259(+)|eukprot:CAMPEP_0118934710 /NCGR_PEP_ID=MMETSP1169-20130426/13974_1 /TAXON_ID=36882 /ORGANISM="Pyramimonas obovata, Strain CCMP722" /LENGTH=327 /DNA_ID=CAMNT_0006877639 /DNA_START=203 /DNA_END=1186 /DNA_ORIENTATION=-